MKTVKQDRKEIDQMLKASRELLDNDNIDQELRIQIISNNVVIKVIEVLVDIKELITGGKNV